MHALIVDDEMLSRAALQERLLSHCPAVQQVSQAASVKEAAAIIQAEQPQLVFLDIEMPVEDGFVLFNYFPEPEFHTVFVTAFDQFAIRAFRVAAADYLLKPIKTDELVKAVQRITARRSKPEVQKLFEALHPQLQPRIGISTLEGMHFIDLVQVELLKADDNYTHLFILDGRKIMSSKKLKHYEDLLGAYPQFLRVHRSYIVNVNYILSYNKGLQILTTRNGQEVPVSRDRKPAIEAFFDSLIL